MATLPQCPRCGDNEYGFWTKAQMHGPAELFYNPNGEYDEMSTDRMYTTESGVIYCGKCNKMRRDLILKNNKITTKEEGD